MSVVIGGHVDHGKSTIVGRLLADTGSLPDGKLESIRDRCARTGRVFEYAFLLDALRDEQAQGITIDAARVFFRTALREYVLIDAPGHVEFVRNMVTGASRAEAALLVIDAQEGVQENSRRHGALLGLLGIRQIAVLVNKMDLVGWREDAFEDVAAAYRGFLASVGVTPTVLVPVSGREGALLTGPSPHMPWYRGPSVLEVLDGLRSATPEAERPFRMPVQDVYRFSAQGDERRIVAGTVESGTLRAGDTVVFYPSGKHTRVGTLEAFARERPEIIAAGEPAGFTLTDQVYVPRGELAARAGEPPPHVTARLRASVFWLGRDPLRPGREYGLRLGTARVPMWLESVARSLDPASLAPREGADAVGRHEIAECVLTLGRALAFDLAEQSAGTGRFVIVEDFEICGGGIVREALADPDAWMREKVIRRNLKWEPSAIAADHRAERYGQRPHVVLVTGVREPARKTVAKSLEADLFAEGRVVYYVGMANVLYGVDADLGRGAAERREHWRRLAEIANLMLDAGVILVVTAAEVTADDLAILRTGVTPDRLSVVWVGDTVTTDAVPDLHLPDVEPAGDATARVRALLQGRGVVMDAPGPGDRP